MIGRERAFAVLERALAELERAGAKGAQATLNAGASALTRFANNYIHQNVAEEDASLSLAAAVGRKLGGVSTNRLDRAGIGQAARQAVAIARQAADDPDFPGFPEAPAAPSTMAVAAALKDEPAAYCRAPAVLAMASSQQPLATLPEAVTPLATA